MPSITPPPVFLHPVITTICCPDSLFCLSMFKASPVKLLFFFLSLSGLPGMMKGHYLNPSLKDVSALFLETNWRQRPQDIFPSNNKERPRCTDRRRATRPSWGILTYFLCSSHTHILSNTQPHVKWEANIFFCAAFSVMPWLYFTLQVEIAVLRAVSAVCALSGWWLQWPLACVNCSEGSRSHNIDGSTRRHQTPSFSY